MDALDRPLPSIALPDILHLMTQYFTLRVLITHPVSEFDKIEMLTKACNVGPWFPSVFHKWKLDHPQEARHPPVAGDQSYHNLVAVLEAEDLLRHPVVLSVHHAVANQALKPGVADDLAALQAQVATQAAALAALQVRYSNGGGRGGGGHGSRRSRPTMANPVY